MRMESIAIINAHGPMVNLVKAFADADIQVVIYERDAEIAAS